MTLTIIASRTSVSPTTSSSFVVSPSPLSSPSSHLHRQDSDATTAAAVSFVVASQSSQSSGCCLCCVRSAHRRAATLARIVARRYYRTTALRLAAGKKKTIVGPSIFDRKKLEAQGYTLEELVAMYYIAFGIRRTHKLFKLLDAATVLANDAYLTKLAHNVLLFLRGFLKKPHLCDVSEAIALMNPAELTALKRLLEVVLLSLPEQYNNEVSTSSPQRQSGRWEAARASVITPGAKVFTPWFRRTFPIPPNPPPQPPCFSLPFSLLLPGLFSSILSLTKLLLASALLVSQPLLSLTLALLYSSLLLLIYLAPLSVRSPSTSPILAAHSSHPLLSLLISLTLLLSLSLLSVSAQPNPYDFLFHPGRLSLCPHSLLLSLNLAAIAAQPPNRRSSRQTPKASQCYNSPA